MAAKTETRWGLTGNQLKIIAMVTMTIDHMGMIFYPYTTWLRIIGRIAMPIYAWMIAEGCRHTHDRKQYLLRLFGLGVLCQVGYWVAQRSLYQCILITFSLSVLLIMAIDQALAEKTPQAIAAAGTAAAIAIFLSEGLGYYLPGTDYHLDYGLMGVLTPVLMYYGRPKKLFACIAIAGLGLTFGWIQWWGFLAAPFLLLYNGEKGKWKLGKFFYFYYPAHLVLLYGLDLLIRYVQSQSQLVAIFGLEFFLR